MYIRSLYNMHWALFSHFCMRLVCTAHSFFHIHSNLDTTINTHLLTAKSTHRKLTRRVWFGFSFCVIKKMYFCMYVCVCGREWERTKEGKKARRDTTKAREKIVFITEMCIEKRRENAVYYVYVYTVWARTYTQRIIIYIHIPYIIYILVGRHILW